MNRPCAASQSRCERLGVYFVVKPQKSILCSFRRLQFQDGQCRLRSQLIAVYQSWSPAATEQRRYDNEVDFINQVLSNHRSIERAASQQTNSAQAKLGTHLGERVRKIGMLVSTYEIRDLLGPKKG